MCPDPASPDASVQAWMAMLALALHRQDGPEAARACRWVGTVLAPWHTAQEAALLPLLAAAGAPPALGTQLRADHREMAALARELGTAPDWAPDRQGKPARRLLDLVRQHLDTEAHRVRPLLQGVPEVIAGSRTDAGYREAPVPRSETGKTRALGSTSG